MNPTLSIIIPLKDRAQFTPRALISAGEVGRLIIADGSLNYDPELVTHCRASGDYFYAGHDATLAHWWFKMLLAFDRVRTPYAMVMDNDDMVLAPGINRCIDFLERNPDYIACSGRIQGFWAWPDQVVGPRFSRTKQYAPYDVPADYWQSTANERVLSGFQNSWSYYAVYRTQALKTIWVDVHDLNISDLQVHEKFCAMRALTLGKIKCDPGYTSYLRQIGTSATAAQLPSFAHRLLTRNTTTDRDRVLGKMEMCGVDSGALRERWAQWYDAYLHREYGPWPTFRKALKRRLPKLAWIVQNRHRWGLA